jgi:hypothetical protein
MRTKKKSKGNEENERLSKLRTPHVPPANCRGVRLMENTTKSAKEVYEDLCNLGADDGGWMLYEAACELTNINVFTYFYAEDNRGFFENSDGNALLKWLEIAAFADIEWSHEQPPYEIYRGHKMDVESAEYTKYLADLYPLVLEKIRIKNERK